MDLRKEVSEAVRAICLTHTADEPCMQCTLRINAVMGVVQPAMAAKDAENLDFLEARLADSHRELKRWVVAEVKRAEKAETERDRLRARLTGVAIHAHRLANCIRPDTPAWVALADLRAAVDQPDQEGVEQ